MFWLLIAAGVVAIGGYISGKFSGREYLNFMPVSSFLILAAWFVFLYNYL